MRDMSASHCRHLARTVPGYVAVANVEAIRTAAQWTRTLVLAAGLLEIAEPFGPLSRGRVRVEWAGHGVARFGPIRRE